MAACVLLRWTTSRAIFSSYPIQNAKTCRRLSVFTVSPMPIRIVKLNRVPPVRHDYDDDGGQQSKLARLRRVSLAKIVQLACWQTFIARNGIFNVERSVYDVIIINCSLCVYVSLYLFGTRQPNYRQNLHTIEEWIGTSGSPHPPYLFWYQFFKALL